MTQKIESRDLNGYILCSDFLLLIIVLYNRKIYIFTQKSHIVYLIFSTKTQTSCVHISYFKLIVLTLLYCHTLLQLDIIFTII